MADDFIVEEESPNRTFIYLVGGMGALLVIGLIAIAILALTGNRGENAAIRATNEAIAAANARVTQTLIARETIAAYSPTPSPLPPTATATRPATSTPVPPPPTFTPSPVAQTAIPVGTAVAAGTAEPTADAAAALPTPTPTPIATAGGQLPAGGLPMWGAIILAAVLGVVIVLARRLRPAL